MLTDKQIVIARKSRHIDVHESIDGLKTSMCHTPDGVFVIQELDDIVIISYMISYIHLAIMNSRQWPITKVFGQRPMVKYLDSIYAAKGRPSVSQEDPGKDWLDMIFFGKDSSSYPVLDSLWLYKNDGRTYTVKSIIQRSKKATVKTIELTCPCRVMLLSLEEFQKSCRPI